MKTPIQVSQPTPHSVPLLDVEQAQQRIRDYLQPVSETQTLGLRDSLARILAQHVVSPIAVPPYDNSAMDGYAVRSADLPAHGIVELQLSGTVFAGKPFSGNLAAKQCVRIMTGAQIPQGADTVIMQEHVSLDQDRIRVSNGHQLGENVRRAGEDIQRGQTVLVPGKKLGAAELGLLASLGIAQVDVYRRIRVAFFSTGDELRPVGSVLQPGQIYDSNRYTLFAMLQQSGAELIDLGVVKDDRDAIEQTLHDAASQADVIITSGGVSVGDADYVKEALQKLGQVNFWRIAMKPGKPLAVGKINQAYFFGLPGNPVSVMATFYQFVLSGLRHLMGESERHATILRAVCTSRLKKAPGRTDYQRGILSRRDGRLTVSPAGMQSSHILSGMSRANCFLILPKDSADIEAGSDVDVQPFSDFWF